ncbi:MAG: gliding motility-associated C-terminal domain-containing protein [Crocinitomicaceae bacterium]|nr:gliding motility-associated C-terminal domain-containing protein [Crocinitomicaceae bacterium]
MMRYNFLVLIIVCGFINMLNAQMLITDADFDATNPLDCATIAGGLPAGGATNFTDGPTNYSSNMNDTIVFCPDLSQGSKVGISFGTNIGFEWNVDGTDTLYVYDGNSTAAPLIGSYNSVTDPSSFFVQASWNNPTGCLTLVFVSDGANEGTGWVANVSCGNPFQPFEPHLEAYINGVGTDAINPSDTGYVDVCFGDSILFIAKPDFPNSFETNGFGYEQNVENCSFNWTISNVGQFTNDSLWFTPPARTGYYLDLRITDVFPLNDRITCKVRVSQLPNFTGTGPMEDTVCMGMNTSLVGGVTATDTVGIDIPVGSLDIGGVFAELTALPDGNGVQYDSDIGFAGFGDAVITSVNDIEQLCIDIEHSYLGDLEISLTCPNGTSVSLVNAYTGAGEMTAGGCAGGGVALGNDTDVDGGVPGSPVWTYCFSELNATLGTICNELGNTVVNDYGNNSIDPAGVYLPDGGFTPLIGCPISGPWTITVQDNQGIDDGYIFQWGIDFNAALYPEPEGYQNSVVSEDWQDHPTIISGQNDTLLVVQPDSPGYSYYVYEITDDFGCDYDTTVALYALPQPIIFSDTIGCNLGYFVNGTESYNGGTWSASDTAISFSPSADVENPAIYTSTPGVYTITFTDNACNTAVTAEIDYPPYPYTYFTDTTLCNGVIYNLTAPNTNEYETTYQWVNGPAGETISISEPGTYTVQMSNICHSGQDSIVVDYRLCDIDAPNVLSLAEGSQNSLWYVKAEGLASFNLTITNRWGNVVYECNNSDGTCYWDGRNKGGLFVEAGTYFYIIDATIEGGEELQKHGFLEVLR